MGWSPGGGYFAHYRWEAGGIRLVVRTEDGKAEFPVTRVGWLYGAAWSPDGKYLAYMHAENDSPDSDCRVYVWSSATKESVEVARGYKGHQFGYGTGYGIPLWAPDSKRFVCKVRRVLDPEAYRLAPTVFSVDASTPIQLLPNHWDSGGWLPGTWSPDSQWITTRSETSESAPWSVWVCRADGSETKELVRAQSDVSLSEPVWSPDGKWIAYPSSQDRSNDQRGMRDIWLITPEGSEAHAITKGQRDSTEGQMTFDLLHWSPDSRYVSAVGYRLDALGVSHHGIYLVNAETKDMITVFANSRENSEVVYDFMHVIAWSHAADRLVYTGKKHDRHGEPGDNQQLTNMRDILMMYDLRARKLTTLLEVSPQEDALRLSLGWFPDWVPTWSPDDKHVLFTHAKVISLGDGNYEPDVWVADLAEPQAPTPSPQPSAPTAAPTAGVATIIIPQHRRAAEIAAALPDSYRGAYQLDAGLNALVLSTADEKQLAALQQDIALLDRPVPQIMVDVLVTELSRDASRQLGLDWEYAKKRWSAILPLVDTGDAGQVIYQGVGELDKTFFSTLSALEEKGEANVRANPRVLARCGSLASINIRRTDNFFYDAGTDYQGKPVRARSDISADIILKITPQLLGSDRIAMSVDATVDSFIFGGKNDLPDTTRRQAITDVVCGNGETIVIGGLTQQEQTVKTQKTPLLGDLPLLGQLFRHTSRAAKDSTLVIFITPRVAGEGEGTGS